jgi:hypothetical protein
MVRDRDAATRFTFGPRGGNDSRVEVHGDGGRVMAARAFTGAARSTRSGTVVSGTRPRSDRATPPDRARPGGGTQPGLSWPVGPLLAGATGRHQATNGWLDVRPGDAGSGLRTGAPPQREGTTRAFMGDGRVVPDHAAAGTRVAAGGFGVAAGSNHNPRSGVSTRPGTGSGVRFRFVSMEGPSLPPGRNNSGFARIDRPAGYRDGPTVRPRFPAAPRSRPTAGSRRRASGRCS